jgi:hypothetical protein
MRAPNARALQQRRARRRGGAVVAQRGSTAPCRHCAELRLFSTAIFTLIEVHEYK